MSLTPTPSQHPSSPQLSTPSSSPPMHVSHNFASPHMHSPTLESPILSTNTSQFSTGSCLDYSFERNAGVGPRIETPKHLFHENVPMHDNSLDTLDENNNSMLSNVGRNLFNEEQVASSPVPGRKGILSPQQKRRNHGTYVSSPIAKMGGTLGKVPSSAKSQRIRVSSAIHTTFDDAPPVSPVVSRNPQNHIAQSNLMLSPLLSPTKSIHTSNMLNTYPSTDIQINDTNIVHYITNLFDQQRRINVMNMKLNCVNLFANFANILKTNSLQHRCRELSVEADQRRQDCDLLRHDVSRGKERIQDLEQNLEESQVVIQSLNHSVQDLNQSVHEQGQKLEYASTAYNQSLRHLEKSLGYYKKILAQYESSKLRRDLAFDGSLFVACLYIVNTYVVNLPVQLLVTLMRFQRRSTSKWMQFFIKTCVMMLLFLCGRRVAIKYHMHSAMGSVSTYGAYMLQGVFESVASLAWKGKDDAGSNSKV